MRIRTALLVCLLVAVTVGCSGDDVVVDENTVWDLVACSIDDEGFNVLDEDYPPEDLGGLDDMQVHVESDPGSDRGALAMSLLKDDDARLTAIQDRLDSDERVLSTHRDSTTSAACFSSSASSP